MKQRVKCKKLMLIFSGLLLCFAQVRSALAQDYTSGYPQTYSWLEPIQQDIYHSAVEALLDTDLPLWDAFEFDERLHQAFLSYLALEHQKEAQSLAFGGVLSHALTNGVQSAPPEFGLNSGSFHTVPVSSHLFLDSDWNAVYGPTGDRLNVFSRYSFNQLQTTSRAFLTGSGFVSRTRVEQHKSFDEVPLLRGMGLFDFNDPMNVREITRRQESYHTYFNGALANQSIQRAGEFNPHANVPGALSAPSPALYDQDTRKRPPSSFGVPPSPPRPQPAVATGPGSNRGGVMADIKISDADFAPAKK
jgi:hypothetical protein